MRVGVRERASGGGGVPATGFFALKRVSKMKRRKADITPRITVMPLSREKAFETISENLLILVSVYTSVRVLRDLENYTTLFASTTMLPSSASTLLLLTAAVLQTCSALALVWPRLETIRNGKLIVLGIMCQTFILQLVVCFASKTGRSRTVALVLASFLQVIREGSSRSKSHIGMDFEASLYDRFYGKMRDSATRYKGAAISVLLMMIYTGLYLQYANSVVFTRHRLQKEIGVEQFVDLLGAFTWLFTVGSYQQNKRVVFSELDIDDDEANMGRVARAKRALAGIASRAWEGKGAKKSFKHL